MNEDRVNKIAANITAGQIPHYDNVDDYVDFISRTLVPDLKRSGKEYTAEDLMKLVKQIRHTRWDGSHIRFLKSTLIPDLRSSREDSIADDFEEGIYWLTHTIEFGDWLRLIDNNLQEFGFGHEEEDLETWQELFDRGAKWEDAIEKIFGEDYIA